MLPDLPVGFVYLLVGRENDRQFWLPENADWVGVRDAHPIWAAMWEIPHSFLFLIVVALVVAYWRGWQPILIAAYASHLVLDILTHTGEWAVAPFYPLPLRIEGFTDAWAWHPAAWLLSWLILICLIFAARKLRLLRGHPDGR